MSDRITLKCFSCNDQKVIAKRFSLKEGWHFFCCPTGGIPVIKARPKGELKAQIRLCGLNDQDKEKLVMAAAFNDWLEKHKGCICFGIDLEV